MTSFAPSLGIRHKHANVLTPSMFMAHEPQIPSLHDRRKVRVGSTSFLILIIASRIYAKESITVRTEPQISRSRAYHRTALVEVDGVRLQEGLLGRFIGVLWHIISIISPQQ